MEQKTLGEYIKDARIKRKMTQKELANKVGFESAVAINLIESGKRGISAEKFLEIINILQMDFNFLLRQSTQKTLRDEFAMAALTGMIVVTGKGYLCHPTDLENFAHDAFRYADAMMKEREKHNEE